MINPGDIIEYRLAGETGPMQMALVTQVIPAPFRPGQCAFMVAQQGAVTALIAQPEKKPGWLSPNDEA